MKNRFKILLILLLAILTFPISTYAEEKEVNVYMFYGRGCPHCAAEEKYFGEYLKDHKNVNLYRYEVWYNQTNQKLYSDVQEVLNERGSGVPYTIIGDKVIIGFGESSTPSKIEQYINECMENDEYNDNLKELMESGEKTTTPIEVDETKTSKVKKQKKDNSNKKQNNNVDVPILGSVNPRTVSLPILAVVLGFVDGFNPCAMWILIFLITMLFNMKDRKKMWILGLTFILTSGVVYLAFMLTWLNLANFINKLFFIRLLIAVIAIVAGIINLVKYSNSLNNKDEGCDVVDKNDRKKIMDSIIKITNENKFILSLLGIMVLAASVNIIELMCSIGIPLLFTQILAMNNLNVVQYGFYIFIYLLFFLIDDIAVFFVAMKTCKVTGISTKYTKYSHLLGGIIMLIIGILLLIKPELLMFNF